jgi:hypothetical protein
MTTKRAAANTGFASGGQTCKLEALCFYLSVVLVDSFVLLCPPERKARKRCVAYRQIKVLYLNDNFVSLKKNRTKWKHLELTY